MDWNKAILQVIDFRSFSSVWYWLGVAITWSGISYRVIGVPYDMIQRAKREGGQAEVDLTDMVRAYVNRQLFFADMVGIWLIGVLFFWMSVLAVLGFVYRIEMAQAVFLILFPLTFIGALRVTTSRKIDATKPQGEALYAVLQRHKLYTQIIGMIAIFFTALFGMFHNLAIVRAF